MTFPPALREPRFRSMWAAGLISDAGDWMLLVALPIFVYELTGSALGTSAAFLAELAPSALLSPLGGWLADRTDRRQLMLAVTAAQAVALLPLLLVHDRHGLAIVYAVIVVEASLAAIFDPARSALLPTLIAARSDLVSANSLIALGTGIARLAGGPLGGLLLAAGSLHTIVIADALSFGLAAILIGRLDPGRPAAAMVGGATAVEVTHPPAPAAQVQSDRPTIRAALGLAFVAQVAQGIFVVLFVVFVARRLHGGPAEIGLLRGIQAVGGIAAGAILALRTSRGSPGELAARCLLAFGAISLVVWNAPALSTAPVLFLALFIVIGAPGVGFEAGLTSTLQLAAAGHERGRAFGALGFAGAAGQALGMAIAGLLTPWLGLMAVLQFQGGLYVSAGLVAAVAVRGRRRALASSGDARSRSGLSARGRRRTRLAGHDRA